MKKSASASVYAVVSYFHVLSTEELKEEPRVPISIQTTPPVIKCTLVHIVWVWTNKIDFYNSPKDC
jgi:hypothetical protein